VLSGFAVSTLLALSGCASQSLSAHSTPLGVSVQGSAPGTVLGSASGASSPVNPIGKPTLEQATVNRALQKTGVTAVQIENSNDIVLVMPSDVRFATASAALSPKFQGILTDV